MEAHSQAPQLERRAVGLPTAISTVFGLIVATTVLVSVGQGFAASWIFLAALGIGLLAMYMQAFSFSELATMMPKAGSMNEYVAPVSVCSPARSRSWWATSRSWSSRPPR